MGSEMCIRDRDKQLATHEFVVGDYSIADMAIWPWAQNWEGQEQNLDDKPHLTRWLEAVGARPAVQRGKALGEEFRNNVQTEEEKREANRILFGQK